MLPLQNNSYRNLPSEKGKGAAGAFLIHAGLVLLLLVLSFSAPRPPEEEKGILVNFGTDETGTGLVEPSTAQAAMESPPPPVAAQTLPDEEAVATQDFDKEAPEIKKTDPEAEKKKRELEEAEKARRAELEAARIKKAREDAEKKRIEEEQRRINEIASRTKNALSGAKNTGTTSASEGVAGGAGNQGVPSGSVDSKVRGQGGGTGNNGISFDLAGRSFQLLPQPRYDYQGEGRVVVEISVDRNGNVTQAIPGAKGSTTLDEYLLNAAKEAALKAKFEPKPDATITQKGTITYNFILK